MVIALNLFAGLILWFGYCTDYSWAGSMPDYIYPPAVAFVALVSLRRKDKGANRRSRRRYRLACMPSLIGGGMAIVLMVIMFVPPLLLASLFTISEIAGETLIQSAVSPDGTRVANVYFRPVGAYSGGNGHVFIRVRYRWLPIVERDIYYVRMSSAHEYTHDYLQWKDANTLHISRDWMKGTSADVTVGTIRFETPEVIALPIRIMRSLSNFGGVRR